MLNQLKNALKHLKDGSLQVLIFQHLKTTSQHFKPKIQTNSQYI
nr:MAG TPA: hypothetical protein [Caudoviricetes sp.]